MADNLRKYTTQEVLNKVYTDSSGDTIGLQAQTSKETLNAVLNTSTNSLNVSLSGSNTISGDVTITGDLTVQGSGGAVYDEIIEGSLHIKTASSGQATADTAADELVVENSGSGGISILTPDNSLGQLAFGSASDAYGAFIGWKHDDNQMTIATANAGDSIVLQTANKTTALTIDSSQNATFAKGVTISNGNLDIAATKKLFFDAGGDTFIHEQAANKLDFFVGNGTRFVLDSDSRISLSNNDSGGTNNTIFGYQAGLNVTTNGDMNTLIGHTAGVELTSGEDNTGVGFRSIYDIKEGGFNTAVGSFSLGGSHGSTADASSENVAIGYSAMGGNFNNSATTDQCVAIGALTMNSTLNNVDGTVAIGYKSLLSLTSGAGNTAIGFEAGKDTTTGENNTLLGYQAGQNILGGNNNIAIGTASGETMTGVSSTVLVGKQAGQSINNASAIGTVAIGHQALKDVTNGAGNVAIGFTSGKNFTDGGNNVSVGHGAMSSSGTSASQCTGVGSGALLNATGSNNTSLGYNSGDVITSGTLNTVIGYTADPSGNSATNQTVIGASATGQSDNSVTLGNGDVTDVYMAQDSAAIVHAGGIRTGSSAMLGVGQTPADENSSEVGPGYLNLFRDDTASVKQILFGKNGSEVGSISNDGSNTAFNTSSDYRLKENEVEIPDGLERLNKLKPYRFNWKSENDEDGKPTRTVDGLFAHEVAEIIPEAVIGKKDAVDSNGKMKIQSMDYSKVVPLLIKAVQELSAKVAELEKK